jgi:hypothetical protein
MIEIRAESGRLEVQSSMVTPCGRMMMMEIQNTSGHLARTCELSGDFKYGAVSGSRLEACV